MQEPQEVTPETLFDFQSVADNVLQFVTGRIGAARADRQVRRRPDQDDGAGPQGVDKGFSDARKQLGGWADNEDIKTGMDQSCKLIQKGLDEFERRSSSARCRPRIWGCQDGQPPAGPPRDRDPGRGQGDVALQRQLAVQVPERWGRQPVQPQVEPELRLLPWRGSDSAEMDAIGTLVKGLDELAGQFFKGDSDGKTLATG